MWRSTVLVKTVSQQILLDLTHEQTADELILSLFPAEPQVIYAALDRLVIAGEVGHRVATVQSADGVPHTIRVFFRVR